MDHVGEECADVAFAFDSVVDREAVRALYFHVAFPEQFAVRLVALVDFVEHDLVVDVADVGDSRRQCGVLVGEVQVQLGEFAEPSLGVVAVLPRLVGRFHGFLGFLAGAAYAFHLVGGEQFLADGVPYVVPAHDARDLVPEPGYPPFREKYLFREHGCLAWCGGEQFAQRGDDPGPECGVRLEPLPGKLRMVVEGVIGPVGMERPRQTPIFHTRCSASLSGLGS